MPPIDVQIAGEIAGDCSLADLANRLSGREWAAEAGPYVVRLTREGTTFVFALDPRGGFILEDVMPDNDVVHDAWRLSEHLRERDLRHRLEVYDGDRMIACFHHDWPEELRS